MRINTFNHNTDDIMDSADNYEDIYEEIRLDPYTQLPFARNNNNNMPEIHKNVMTVQSIQHNIEIGHPVVMHLVGATAVHKIRKCAPRTGAIAVHFILGSTPHE